MQVQNRIFEDAIKLSRIRDNILNDVVGFVFPRLSDIQNYPAYEFYCPFCHQDQLEALLEEDFNAFSEKKIRSINWDENSFVQLINWENEIWRCKTCERETHRPIPVHKLYKQVLYPTYDSLLLENEKERLKNYSDLKEKKIVYKQEAEREIEEINRENRRDLDEQVFKLRAMESQVRSTKRTIDVMQRLMVSMEQISREKMSEIDRYADDIQRQILTENQQIEKSIQREVNENIRQTEQDMEKLAYQAQQERIKQHAVQVQIAQGMQQQNQQLAEINKNVKASAAVNMAYAKRSELDKKGFLGLGTSDLDKAKEKI